jgi:hypothetical protein
MDVHADGGVRYGEGDRRSSRLALRSTTSVATRTNPDDPEGSTSLLEQPVPPRPDDTRLRRRG